jgi:hypothetical protein
MVTSLARTQAFALDSTRARLETMINTVEEELQKINQNLNKSMMIQKKQFADELIKSNKNLRLEVTNRLDVFEESGDKKLAT